MTHDELRKAAEASIKGTAWGIVVTAGTMAAEAVIEHAVLRVQRERDVPLWFASIRFEPARHSGSSASDALGSLLATMEQVFREHSNTIAEIARRVEATVRSAPAPSPDASSDA